MKIWAGVLWLILNCQIPMAATYELDLQKVLFLHPAMQSWHYGMGTFFRTPPKTPEMASEIVQSLRDRLNSLELQEVADLEELRQAFQSRLVETAKQLRGMQRAEQIEEIKEGHRKAVTQLEQSVSERRKRLLQEFFLDASEARQRLLEMEQEVFSVAQQVAGEDHTLVIRRPQQAFFEKQVEPLIHAASRLGEYQNPLRLALSQDYARMDSLDELHASATHKIERESLMYLQAMEKKISGTFSLVRPSSYVSRGMRSLDSKVLLKLAEQYNLNQHQREVLKRFSELGI